MIRFLIDPNINGVQGARLTENDVICHKWAQKSRSPEGVNKVSNDVICYRGTQASPYWMDEDPSMPEVLLISQYAHIGADHLDSYWPLYTVRADTSGIYKHKLLGTKGFYHLIVFDIVLTVGLTTLQAQIRWKERENVSTMVSLYIFVVVTESPLLEKGKLWSLFSSGYGTQNADRMGEAEIVYEESVNYLLE